ncbi:MAG: nucleoside hydrolase [Bacteroidales bacterium]|nr:nucleoside hydrolase [Bacteroidales bacterium]
MTFFKHIAFVVLFILTFFAHAQKKTLIIDSDAGTDDYRAIILMLQLNNYDVKAIVFSDGNLFPDKGAYRCEVLLKCFNKSNILVGSGKKTMYNKPMWRKYAEAIPWTTCYNEPLKQTTYPSAKEIIINILQNSPDKSVVIASLGSLSNLYEVLTTNTKLSEKIEKIVWYNSPDIYSGTNYVFAPKAAEYVLSLNIPIFLIHSISKNPVVYSNEMLENIKHISTQAAKQIFFQLDIMKKDENTNHLHLWDELVSLYLANPDIFTLKVNVKQPNIYFITNYETESLKRLYIQIIEGTYKPNFGVVFSVFPNDSFFYRDDVNKIREQLIQRYGNEEFELSVLTSEIHNHLGVYSILGVKMGLYAREILQAPLSKMNIISYAGKYPPLSCLNDGIMIATGNTPAINGIQIDTSKSQPLVKFCYRQRCILLSLKTEIYQRIKSELEAASIQFGLSNNEYWKAVRKLALYYWLELDRSKIFDVQEE